MNRLSNNHKITHITLFFLCVMLIFAIPLSLKADSIANCDSWVAKIVSIEGQVKVREDAENEWRSLKVEESLCGGEMIQVFGLSRAAVFLREQQTTIRLDQHTVMTLPKAKPGSSTFLEIVKGIANFFSRTPMSFKVKTPFLNAGIEGTEFSVKVKSKTTEIIVMEGRVLAGNTKGSIRLRNNEKTIATANMPPRKTLIVNSRDTVQWALYYPPIIDYSSKTQLKKAQEINRDKVFTFYETGNVVKAINELKKIPAEKRTISDYNLEAGLLLSMGRVDQARLSLANVTQTHPDNSTAQALESIIELVNNDKKSALRLARKAVANNSTSSVARIALSYALQANFNIELAIVNLEEAATLSPNNSLIQARIAELELARGQTNHALIAARRAAILNPNLSYAQTVLGFSYLIKVDLPSAISAFQQAIALDSSDPLPRLGLGLSKIRKGDLDGGTLEIEIAAGLNPNNPLIRTYLGKSYYDQKKGNLAANEYEVAKELDPKDPTSWFFQAIQKQTENRPIDALSDLQKAIKLNDNRLINRSRQLIESDLAASNAALGRIFFNLDFQQRALVEGWNSIGNNFLDYSGHRFLADSYSSLPRHEIAQASELLQSQLLQPINSAPVSSSSPSTFSIQSQTVTSASDNNRSLVLIDTNGPAEASLNEFRPLFNRNKISLFSSGVVGNQDTLGDEVVISGIKDNFSFSLGQSHIQTKGFRNNNDAKNDAYNIYLQNKLTDDTHIVAEYRYLKTEQGDLQQRFNGDFASDLRQNLQAHLGRFGFHHAWSEQHALSGSFVYVDSNSVVQRILESNSIDTKINNQDFNIELQDSFRTNGFSVTSGFGYYNRDQNRIITAPIRKSQLHQKESNYNGYLYSQFNLGKKFDLTIGLSADASDIDGTDANTHIHLNPKFGLTWKPTLDTTARLAVFRASKRKLANNQTLEPTQIAGFNQFFDDIEDAVSWRYGVGVDHRLSSNLFAGIELSARNLDNPKAVSWHEVMGRSYLYWAPHPWWSLSTDYFYEYLDHKGSLAEAFNLTKTHRIQLGLTFVHPSGFTARLSPSFVYQKGDFFNFSTSSEAKSGNDQFIVVGIMAGYRLPKRYGFLSIQIENLFDQHFNFQETDQKQPLFENERRIIGGLTLNF
ncbi:MAG: FecR domain-containing protein [Methylococcales bacterium]